MESDGIENVQLSKQKGLVASLLRCSVIGACIGTGWFAVLFIEPKHSLVGRLFLTAQRL